MFDSLSDRLGGVFDRLKGRGALNESDVRAAMREVRIALLEADVALPVAREFIEGVTERAVGEQVLKSLRPDQQVVGIVHQGLIDLMSGDHELSLKKDGVSIIMMCGLQGSGKTTTCGKLARLLKEQGRSPMLVAADLQRPAAIEQLRVIGDQIGCPVYHEDPAKSDPVQVCRNGVKQAKANGANVIILDTAGRLGIDEELMKELQRIDNRVSPDVCLFVCDSMTGQDAVNSAKAFNEALELDGIVLTKLDGDTRGGAALSVRAVTGVPIKFIGVGEQLDRLEKFHPDRMAGRILGMGDVVSLVEKAQQEFDEEEMLAQQEKMQAGKFTLDDFCKQMKQVKKLGSMREIMKMIPGMGKMVDQMGDMNPEDDMRRVEGIINSMTLNERRDPDQIDRSRRIRIAKGSGVEPADVNKLLKDFSAMGKMMQDMSNMGLKDRMKAVKQMADGGMMNPNAELREKKLRSKRGPADSAEIRDKRKKQRKDARKSKKRNRK